MSKCLKMDQNPTYLQRDKDAQIVAYPCGREDSPPAGNLGGWGADPVPSVRWPCWAAGGGGPRSAITCSGSA